MKKKKNKNIASTSRNKTPQYRNLFLDYKPLYFNTNCDVEVEDFLKD